MERSARPVGGGVQSLLIVLLALLAPFGGGGRDPWLLGALLFLSGFCMLIWPAPYRLPSRWWIWGAAFLVWCSISLWPVGGIQVPAWRGTLTETYGFKFSVYHSPQPWISLDILIFWMAGLLWFFYVGSLMLGRRRRRFLVRWFYYGILLLAAVSFVAKLLKVAVPGWYEPDGFGPFENRNQFGALLAMAGVAGMALMFDDFRQKNRRGWLIGAGQLLIFNALIWNYSRAGIILFFGGTALWVLLAYTFSLRRARSWVAMSCVLLALSSFLLFGGKTTQRFTTTPGVETGAKGRWLVQQDAMAMVRDQPLTGVGLGNFEGIFPFYRKQFQSEDFVRHPESDWIWLASEAGIPAVLFLAGLVVLVVRGCLPFKAGSDRAMRAAGLTGLLILVAHGFVDVSGHRAGTLWPALMLGALAFPPGLKTESNFRQTRIMGLAALVLVAAGLSWLLTGLQVVSVPGRARAALLEKEMRQDMADHKYRGLKMAADSGLESAPLNWFFYYVRAVAQLQVEKNPYLAVEDFRRARILEQDSPKLPFEEGKMLLPYDGGLALAAWSETLKRCRKNPEEWYGTILMQIGDDPELRLQLAMLAKQDPALVGHYWLEAAPDEAGKFLDQQLAPGGAVLRESQKQPDWIWKLWLKLRGADDMEPFLKQHPKIQRRIWRDVADAYIRAGELEKGYGLSKKEMEPPALPQKFSDDKVRAKAVHDLLRNPGEVVALAGLSREALDHGNANEVLFYLEPVKDKPGLPPYFYYMLGEAYAMKEMWGPAVENLHHYLALCGK